MAIGIRRFALRTLALNTPYSSSARCSGQFLSESRSRIIPLGSRTYDSRPTASSPAPPSTPDDTPNSPPTPSSSAPSSSSPQSLPNEFITPSTPALESLSISLTPQSSQNDQPNGSLRTPPVPFHTHKFYTSLEGTFPPPVAATLMSATKSMLSVRTENAKDAALGKNDLENNAYLFRAALSELRTDFTVRTRADTVSLQTTTAAIRREVDQLNAKLKEDIGTLKHDIQMDLNNRKNETRADAKVTDIAIDDISHKFTLTISDLRTEIEQAKWDNTRRGVGVILTLVLFTIVSMEFSSARSKPPKPAPLKEKERGISEEGGRVVRGGRVEERAVSASVNER